jgi:hypothetical protein
MSANLGFETIGNATLTAFDNSKPIITTDPWVDGSPYFGSWGHSYEIPRIQCENIYNSKYVWLSHGHPDHLDALSIEQFKDTIFLIPDHYGNRIYKDLSEKGLNTEIIKSNTWLSLSKHIRVKSFADWNQDAALLINIGTEDIILNLNDGQALGWSKNIKQEIKQFKNRFLLKLYGWGDSDMINFYDPDGNFIAPPASKKPLVGKMYSEGMKEWSCNYSIPFSSSHRYQRTDSNHINKYVTPLKDHYAGFDCSAGVLLPAFITWEIETHTYNNIKPAKLDQVIHSPEKYGDNWSDQLENIDFEFIKNYFNQIDHLKDWLGNIHFVVGGVKNTLKISNSKKDIIFEVPRNSLMAAIKYEIFDDLLIGNFMRTTLINFTTLSYDYTPYVTKYADNGQAKNREEVREYFQAYHKRSSFSYLSDRFRFKSEEIFRRHISPETKLYKIAKPLKKILR